MSRTPGYSRALDLLQRHPRVESARRAPSAPGVEIVLADGFTFVHGTRRAAFTSPTAALGAVRAAIAASPPAPRPAAPRPRVTPAMVDAALDAWFANPRWREVFADGPDVRSYMEKSLSAALAVGGRDVPTPRAVKGHGDAE